MSELKLEVGKKYRTAGGNIMEIVGRLENYPGKFLGSTPAYPCKRFRYDIHGVFGDFNYGLRLVEEVVEESTPTTEKPNPYTPAPLDDISHWNSLCGYYYMQMKDYNGRWNGTRRISLPKLQERIEAAQQTPERILTELKKGVQNGGMDFWPENDDAPARYYWKEEK